MVLNVVQRNLKSLTREDAGADTDTDTDTKVDINTTDYLSSAKSVGKRRKAHSAME